MGWRWSSPVVAASVHRRRADAAATGMSLPHQVITGPLFDRLVDELAAVGVRFELAVESSEMLSAGRGGTWD
jgi:hypothetical protein